MPAFRKIRSLAIKAVNLGRRLLFGCKRTPRAGQVAALSRRMAADMKHDRVRAMHVTVALGRLGAGFPAYHLQLLGFEHQRALAMGQALVAPGTVALKPTDIPFTDEIRQIIALAERRSLREGQWYLGIDHLFFALLAQPDPLLRQLIEAKGYSLEKYRAETEAAYRELQAGDSASPEP